MGEGGFCCSMPAAGRDGTGVLLDDPAAHLLLRNATGRRAARDWLPDAAVPLPLIDPFPETRDDEEAPPQRRAADGRLFPTHGGTRECGTVAAHEGTPACTVDFSCWNCSLGDTACDLTWHCSNAPSVCSLRAGGGAVKQCRVSMPTIAPEAERTGGEPEALRRFRSSTESVQPCGRHQGSSVAGTIRCDKAARGSRPRRLNPSTQRDFPHAETSQSGASGRTT
jgi:hypothetical protein